jgi:hypothetical protein
MVNPAQRRTWVRWVQDVFALSERAACDAGGVARSSVRYQSVAAPHAYSGQSGQVIRFNSARRSGSIRPAHPVHFGQALAVMR